MELAEILEPLIAEKAKEHLKMAEGGDRRSEEYENQGLVNLPNLDGELPIHRIEVETPIDTREEVAKAAGVSGEQFRKTTLVNLPKSFGDLPIRQIRQIIREF